MIEPGTKCSFCSSDAIYSVWKNDDGIISDWYFCNEHASNLESNKHKEISDNKSDIAKDDFSPYN